METTPKQAGGQANAGCENWKQQVQQRTPIIWLAWPARFIRLDMSMPPPLDCCPCCAGCPYPVPHACAGVCTCLSVCDMCLCVCDMCLCVCDMCLCVCVVCVCVCATCVRASCLHRGHSGLASMNRNRTCVFGLIDACIPV